MTERALGDRIWGRKAARLPERGVLLVSTDLQGNLRDYQRMKALLEAELESGQRAALAFCGDLVHGPSPDLNAPGAWPPHLGTEYRDESRELLLDFEAYSRERPAFSLLGNHEHAHIGGPPVPKFYPDEAAVLDRALGTERHRMHDFLRTFPLLAVARCGLVLTHGAPAATEGDLEAFESLKYDGYDEAGIHALYTGDTVGTLLWARAARDEQARALLRATLPAGGGRGIVVFGHEIVRAGIERIGDHQICLSTSFGLHDRNKRYLRLALDRTYQTVADVRDGVEVLPLWPKT